MKTENGIAVFVVMLLPTSAAALSPGEREGLASFLWVQ